jgi:DNA invertase Pin-like site-specific DNA recombinase
VTSAVILGRVSTQEKGQDTGNQLGALRATMERLGVKVVGEVDVKCSAWDEKAAADVHRQCMRKLEETGADTLAVWAWDRYSRQGPGACFSELARLEQHLGIRFYSHQEPFLCSGSDPEVRKLLLPIMAWVAESESRRRSERLKASAERKRATVRKLPGDKRALWGRGYLPSNEDRDQALALRAQGLTVREVAKKIELPLGTTYRLLQRK